MTPAGLPHSEIPGSKRVCRSPRLIAACRVLHRRSAPRHPPFTLSSLTIKYLRREKTNLVFLFRALTLVRSSRIPSVLVARFCFQRSSSGREAATNLVRLGGSNHDSRGGDRLVSRFQRSSMVELIGIEPTTYGLQSRRSPS